MIDLIQAANRMLEIAGLTVVLVAVAASTLVFLRRLARDGFEASYRSYRADLGRGVILGLELLIAADIVRSVIIDSTLQNLVVLGGIVLIRTFLSFSIEVELNGHWPWQRARFDQERQTPSGRTRNRP